MDGTLVLLNFSKNTVHFVKVSEELIKALVDKYDNDIEACADEMFASDIGVEMGNCQCLIVIGKPTSFEHWQLNGLWNETKIYEV